VITFLIESDLLLAFIKREDRLKPAAERILRLINSGEITGVYASVATLQEITFWFYNRKMLRELTEAINATVHIRNIEWVELSPEICLRASMLIDEYDISPFDAYHAATAILLDKTILSTEHIYDKIRGVKRIEPEEFANTFRRDI